VGDLTNDVSADNLAYIVDAVYKGAVGAQRIVEGGVFAAA
jgi:hypothetical protein